MERRQAGGPGPGSRGPRTESSRDVPRHQAVPVLEQIPAPSKGALLFFRCLVRRLRFLEEALECSFAGTNVALTNFEKSALP